MAANGSFNGIRLLVLVLPVVAIVSAVMVINSGLKEGHAESAAAEQSNAATAYPDRCFVDLELSDLSPDSRSATVNMYQIFLDYGNLSLGDPTVQAAEQGACAHTYREKAEEIAPRVDDPTLDKKFSRPLIMDSFGRFSSARLLSDFQATDYDDDNWTEAPQHLKTNVIAAGSPFLYPFDSYKLDFTLESSMRIQVDEHSYYEIPLSAVASRETFPGFVIVSKDSKPLEDEDGWTKITLTAQRPTSLRFMTIVVAILGAGAAIWVLIFSERNTLVRNVVGYFLTLWTLRGVIVAGAPRGVIAVDYVFLSVVVILVSILIARLVLPPRKTELTIPDQTNLRET